MKHQVEKLLIIIKDHNKLGCWFIIIIFQVEILIFLNTYFSSQEPPHQTDAVWGFVVAWDGNINKSQWRVGIGEGNNWNVDV